MAPVKSPRKTVAFVVVRVLSVKSKKLNLKFLLVLMMAQLYVYANMARQSLTALRVICMCTYA